MLQRASGLEADDSECDDPMVTLVCNADPENALCPEACRPSEKDEPEEPTVVKAGDLAVSATAAEGRKILKGTPSDADTIKFLTSEEIAISKVVLERYGYSKYDDIAYVRLEDGEWNIIADKKEVNSKDSVSLTIKKDYKSVDGTLNATIVVQTSWAVAGNKTLWFKVVDVVSTAENLNIANYTPYEYEIVDYAWTILNVDMRWGEKNYNYEAGQFYEVARVDVKAPNAAVELYGFTLTNSWVASKLDMNEFLDELTVTMNGKEVSGLKYTANRDDELVISFNTIELAAKEKATFVVNASLSEEFDEYDTVVRYETSSEDVNAVEKKTWARVQVSVNNAGSVKHAFRGSKIKISYTKISSVDAAEGTDDVIVAEWNLTLAEAVKTSFKVTVAGSSLTTGTATDGLQAIDEMRFVVAGEEFDGKKVSDGFEFNNDELEKSGKVQFIVDLVDNDDLTGGSITFSTFNKTAFSGATYVDSRKPVNSGDVAGSISFATLNLQAAKATLRNDLTKNVEFLTQDSTRNYVFDGTYSAKKGLVNLISFTISGSALSGTDTATFYLYVNGEEVDSTDLLNTPSRFNDVEIAAWETANIKVGVEVEAEWTWDYTFDLILDGEDSQGNPIKTAKAAMKTIQVRESGSTKVVDDSASRALVLKASDKPVAEFIVKPSNSSAVTLEELVLSGSLADDAYIVYVDGEEVEVESTAHTYRPDVKLSDNGVVVEVKLANKEYVGEASMTLVSVNGKPKGTTYTRKYAEAIVNFTSYTTDDTYAYFKMSVAASDDENTIKNVELYPSYTGANCTGTAITASDLNKKYYDGDTISFNVLRDDNAVEVLCVKYTINDKGTAEVITRNGLEDFFRVDGKFVAVPKK